MPIYKVAGVKKKGLQKYNVRVNYIRNGQAKQLTRTVYGKEAAKDLERQLNETVNHKGETPARKMTVQQLFDEYVSVKQYEIRESTLDKFERNFYLYIAPELKDIRIDKLYIAVIREWKLSIENKALTVCTKRHAYSVLRALLNYAVKMEYLAKSPLPKVGNFKDTSSIEQEMCFYTPQEFEIFIHTARQIAVEKQTKRRDLSEWHYYVFFNIAFFTGLRKGEIHALKWSDLDGSYLSVKRSITQKLKGADRETPPKNKSSVRTLQMPLPLIQVLDEHRKRMEQSGHFSCEHRICGAEKCLRDSTIQHRNETYASASSLKSIRINDFRHSHVSVLANEGINIQEIARRLGHSKIEMTWNTYSHMYPREEEKAVGVLNKIR